MANGSYSGESPDPYGSAAEVRFADHETFAQGEPDDNQHAGVGPYAGGATRSCAAARQMTETKYVLLEAMTDADIAYNVTRLHRKARRAAPQKYLAILKHADALADYGRRTEMGPDGKRRMKVEE